MSVEVSCETLEGIMRCTYLKGLYPDMVCSLNSSNATYQTTGFPDVAANSHGGALYLMADTIENTGRA